MPDCKQAAYKHTHTQVPQDCDQILPVTIASYQYSFSEGQPIWSDLQSSKLTKTSSKKASCIKEKLAQK